MIIPEQILCDFCRKVDPEYKQLKLPVITNCDWTEGRSEKEHIDFILCDICKDCLMKVTNIKAGFQGKNLTIK